MEKCGSIFKNAGDGLVCKGDSIRGFYISGEEKSFLHAEAKIEGSTILVWNTDIKTPVAVRFDFTNSSIPDLFSKEGLPVNLFRTDNWNNINTVTGK